MTGPSPATLESVTDEDRSPTSTLQFYLLGTFDIRLDGKPLEKPSTLKSQSLLAYLVRHR